MIVIVFHAVDAAKHFGEIERLDRDALRLQYLFAIAHGVERGWAGADRSHAQVAESLHHAADGGEPLQIMNKLRRVGTLGVQRGDGIRNAVLAKIVAGRHLAAEAVAA